MRLDDRPSRFAGHLQTPTRQYTNEKEEKGEDSDPEPSSTDQLVPSTPYGVTCRSRELDATIAAQHPVLANESPWMLLQASPLTGHQDRHRADLSASLLRPITCRRGSFSRLGSRPRRRLSLHLASVTHLQGEMNLELADEPTPTVNSSPNESAHSLITSSHKASMVAETQQCENSVSNSVTIDSRATSPEDSENGADQTMELEYTSTTNTLSDDNNMTHNLSPGDNANEVREAASIFRHSVRSGHERPHTSSANSASGSIESSTNAGLPSRSQSNKSSGQEMPPGYACEKRMEIQRRILNVQRVSPVPGASESTTSVPFLFADDDIFG